MILSGVSVTKSNHLYCFFLAFSLDPLESHHTGEQKITLTESYLCIFTMQITPYMPSP